MFGGFLFQEESTFSSDCVYTFFSTKMGMKPTFSNCRITVLCIDENMNFGIHRAHTLDLGFFMNGQRRQKQLECRQTWGCAWRQRPS